MPIIIMPETTPKKPLNGAYTALRGYGAYTTPQGSDAVPIEITGIVQTQVGSCDLNVISPCVATSIHRVDTINGSGTATYAWIATIGITIVSGQGTDTVTISSSDVADSTFNLSCEVTDVTGTVSSTVSVTHDRIELPIDYLSAVDAVLSVTGAELSTYLKVSDTAYNLAVTTVGITNTSPDLGHALTEPLPIGNFKLKFNAVVNSGICLFTQYHNGTFQPMAHTVVNGANEVLFTSGSSDYLWIYYDGTKLFDVNITGLVVENVIA